MSTNATVAPRKSCLTCPSYLAPENVPSKFKKSIGAPMCATFGNVLGRPGATTTQSQQLAEHYAKNCSAYGSPVPALPLEKRLQVALPDPNVVASPENSQDQAACTTCAMCVNFVPDRVVVQELGWTSGLCAAKGKLILPNLQTAEARSCEYRSFGSVRSNTYGLQLLPEFDDAFNLSVNPIVAYFNKTELVEPHLYPTDKKVSDRQKAGGIRAWRKISDPDGTGNFTYLPIYDEAHFEPEELKKIPRTGDDEHPELYVDHFGGVYMAAVAWRELDETPALWGEAGSGKSEFYRHMAWLMCLPFERLSITASTETDELIGKMLFENNQTTFQYGRLAKAWIKPCVIVLDEPNVGPKEVWHALRPLIDNSKQLVLDTNKAEDLTRHDDCYLGLAMNPAWDPRNVGAEEIADADASRLFHVFIELPPDSIEREIIKARVKLDGWEIDSPRLNALMKAAVEIRALSKDGTIPISWGIRPQIQVARALRWFSPVVAYRRAIADFLETEPQEAILGCVRAHFA